MYSGYFLYYKVLNKIIAIIGIYFHFSSIRKKLFCLCTASLIIKKEKVHLLLKKSPFIVQYTKPYRE